MEEKKAQVDALDSKLFYLAFKAGPIGIALENLEGQPIFVNTALCSMLGFTEDEMRAKHCVDLSPPEDAEKDWALFEELRAGVRDHYQIEKRFFRRDGSMIWGRLSISLFHGASPMVVAMVEDITDKKMAEHSRFRHTALVESSEDAIITKDLNGIIVSWNQAAERIYGYAEAEAVEQPSTILVPPELQDEENRVLERLRAGEHIQHFETVRVTKAGKRVAMSLSVSPIKDLSGQIIGFCSIGRDITERKLAEAALAKVSGKLIEVQEQERTRIARDLHDDINQRLAMLTVEIDRLAQDPPASSAEMSHRLTEVTEQVSEVSMGVQSISHELHSPQLEYLGVVPAIRSFCRNFAARRTLEIDFAHDDKIPATVPYEVSLCLFRVAQEALNNAARHSKVRRFEVSLACVADELHLMVLDRGAGFDMTAMNKEGLGLISMRERVRLVGGAITIESKPMGGTSVQVRIPLNPQHAHKKAAG